MFKTLSQENTLEIRLPNTFIELLYKHKKFKGRAYITKEIQTRLVLDMVRTGEISTGHGAELLNINREYFLRLMAKHGIPYINYSYNDVKKELRDARVV